MTRGENAYKEAKTAGMAVRAGGDRERGKASGPGHRIHLSRVESGRVETEEPRLVSRAQLQCNVSIQLCIPRSAVRREEQTLKLITVIDSYKTVSIQQSAYSLVI